MHFGEIRVESEVGTGSTFFVSLSFEPGPVPASAPMPKTRNAETNRAVNVAVTATAGFGARILLVGDNPVNQKLVLGDSKKEGVQDRHREPWARSYRAD